MARLANSLGYELTKAEAQKSVHSTNPDAIDLMMRGWSRSGTADEGKRCLGPRLLRTRVEHRTTKYRGNGRIAYARFRAGIYGWTGG